MTDQCSNTLKLKPRARPLLQLLTAQLLHQLPLHQPRVVMPTLNTQRTGTCLFFFIPDSLSFLPARNIPPLTLSITGLDWVTISTTHNASIGTCDKNLILTILQSKRGRRLSTSNQDRVSPLPLSPPLRLLRLRIVSCTTDLCDALFGTMI